MADLRGGKGGIAKILKDSILTHGFSVYKG